MNSRQPSFGMPHQLSAIALLGFGLTLGIIGTPIQAQTPAATPQSQYTFESADAFYQANPPSDSALSRQRTDRQMDKSAPQYKLSTDLMQLVERSNLAPNSTQRQRQTTSLTRPLGLRNRL